MVGISLIGWPFDLGRASIGMGHGPEVLLADDAFRIAIADAVGDIEVERVEAVDEGLPEFARVFELDRRLAATVADASARDRFPLVVAGNCISCLGTVAGIVRARPMGVVWLDAHADFDTPEDNLSGFSDVMGLSILTGGSWRALRATIPGFSAVGEADVVLLGTRDLEPYQRQRLGCSQMTVVGHRIDLATATTALVGLADRVKQVYLHVDLDVLDTQVGSANHYAAPDGPDLGTVLALITQTFATVRVDAASITAYDPVYDPDKRILGAARRIAGAIATGVRSQIQS
jgi:arginase